MSKRPPQTAESLIATFKAVQATTPGHVSRETFIRESRLSDRHYLRLFGSYNALVEAAGGTPYTQNRRIDDDTLLRTLRDVWLRNGPVRRSRVARIGPYSLRLYIRRWGNWPRTLAAFRDWLERNDPAFQHLPDVQRQEARASEERPPRARDCGALINFRSCLHAPTSEAGVVLLFGVVAADLGFLIETVGASFPDCEAKRWRGRSWRRLRIEFELTSRNFAEHGHEAGECDLIVCWEHDWPDCPLPVLELKTEIERLRGTA